MSVAERIGLGAAGLLWEAMWLFGLVLQIEFFNVPRPPASQRWCDPDGACELIALNQWLDTFPHWTRFIALTNNPRPRTHMGAFRVRQWPPQALGRRFRRNDSVSIRAPAHFRQAAAMGQQYPRARYHSRHASLPLCVWLTTWPRNQPEVE